MGNVLDTSKEQIAGLQQEILSYGSTSAIMKLTRIATTLRETLDEAHSSGVELAEAAWPAEQLQRLADAGLVVNLKYQLVPSSWVIHVFGDGRELPLSAVGYGATMADAIRQLIHKIGADLPALVADEAGL